MGNVQKGLRYFFEPYRPDLIEHDSQQDRGRERDQQIKKIQHKGIAQGRIELPHPEDLAEGVKADPFTASDPLKQVEVFECNLHTVHWTVAKDQKIGNRQCKQRI
ncbi:hypothetical protein D3C75_1000060 [compost metagenome]